MTVREEIARTIALFLPLCEWTDWDTLPQVYKDGCFYPLANQILSIKGIRIEAENQELPEIPEFQYDPPDKREWLKRGAINYSKILSGWVKCL